MGNFDKQLVGGDIMAHTKKDKLEFPVKEYKITDKYGNVKHIKTRQTTIGKHIWTDADIKYYEELKRLTTKAKRLNTRIEKACQGVTIKPKTPADFVNELIEEIENEVVEKD